MSIPSASSAQSLESSSTPRLTRQEMFDRAYLGLAGQGFAQAKIDGGCVYLAPDGTRCAWGHVDTSLTSHYQCGVTWLREDCIGIAGNLTADDLKFAVALQNAHDDKRSADPATMQTFLHTLATDYGLTVPAIPNTPLPSTV